MFDLKDLEWRKLIVSQKGIYFNIDIKSPYIIPYNVGLINIKTYENRYYSNSRLRKVAISV